MGGRTLLTVCLLLSVAWVNGASRILVDVSTKVCSESSTVSEGPDVEGTATVEKANNKDCVEACRQKSDCVMANFNYGLTASYSSVEDNTCQLKSGFGDAETSVYRDSRSSIVYPDCAYRVTVDEGRDPVCRMEGAASVGSSHTATLNMDDEEECHEACRSDPECAVATLAVANNPVRCILYRRISTSGEWLGVQYRYADPGEADYVNLFPDCAACDRPSEEVVSSDVRLGPGSSGNWYTIIYSYSATNHLDVTVDYCHREGLELASISNEEDFLAVIRTIFREKASSTRNLNYHVNLANLAGSEFTCAAGGDDANDSCADGKLTDVSGVPVGSLGHVIRSEVFTHVSVTSGNKPCIVVRYITETREYKFSIEDCASPSYVVCQYDCLALKKDYLVEAQGNWYQVSEDQLTWTESREYCSGKGLQLASVASAHDWEAVKQIIKSTETPAKTCAGPFKATYGVRWRDGSWPEPDYDIERQGITLSDCISECSESTYYRVSVDNWQGGNDLLDFCYCYDGTGGGIDTENTVQEWVAELRQPCDVCRSSFTWGAVGIGPEDETELDGTHYTVEACMRACHARGDKRFKVQGDADPDTYRGKCFCVAVEPSDFDSDITWKIAEISTDCVPTSLYWADLWNPGQEDCGDGPSCDGRIKDTLGQPITFDLHEDVMVSMHYVEEYSQKFCASVGYRGFSSADCQHKQRAICQHVDHNNKPSTTKVRSYPPVNVHPTSFLLSFDPVVRSCDTACVLRCAATAGCEAASFFSEDGQCRMMGAASRLLATREEDAGGIDAYVIDHVKNGLSSFPSDTPYPCTVNATIDSYGPYEPYKNGDGVVFIPEWVLTLDDCDAYETAWRGDKFREGESQWFIVDLGCDEVGITAVIVKNTANYDNNNCGTKDFTVELSSDKADWTLVAEGTLEDVAGYDVLCDRPTMEYAVPGGRGVAARYVRFTARSHYDEGPGLQYLGWKYAYAVDKN